LVVPNKRRGTPNDVFLTVAPSRLVKNVIGEALGWQIWSEKRLGRRTGLTPINRHFEAKSDAAAVRKIVVQQSARAESTFPPAASIFARVVLLKKNVGYRQRRLN